MKRSSLTFKAPGFSLVPGLLLFLAFIKAWHTLDSCENQAGWRLGEKKKTENIEMFFHLFVLLRNSPLSSFIFVTKAKARSLKSNKQLPLYSNLLPLSIGLFLG